MSNLSKLDRAGGSTATFESILKAIKTIDGQSVKVGLLESKGGAAVPEGSPMTIAGIGAIHEFGTLYATNADGEQLIPERRWLRGTFEHYKADLVQMQTKIVKGLMANRVKPEHALKMLGVWAVNKVKFYVKGTDNVQPGLAESTIEAKGSTRPLVDTGLMINSVNYEIDNAPADTQGGKL